MSVRTAGVVAAEVALGLRAGSYDISALKKTFRRLALERHPDKNGNNPTAKEQFQELMTSYELLKRYISGNMNVHNDDADDDDEDDEDDEDDWYDDDEVDEAEFDDAYNDYLRFFFSAGNGPSRHFHSIFSFDDDDDDDDDDYDGVRGLYCNAYATEEVELVEDSWPPEDTPWDDCLRCFSLDSHLLISPDTQVTCTTFYQRLHLSHRETWQAFMLTRMLTPRAREIMVRRFTDVFDEPLSVLDWLAGQPISWDNVGRSLKEGDLCEEMFEAEIFHGFDDEPFRMFHALAEPSRIAYLAALVPATSLAAVSVDCREQRLADLMLASGVEARVRDARRARADVSVSDRYDAARGERVALARSEWDMLRTVAPQHAAMAEEKAEDVCARCVYLRRRVYEDPDSAFAKACQKRLLAKSAGDRPLASKLADLASRQDMYDVVTLLAMMETLCDERFEELHGVDGAERVRQGLSPQPEEPRATAEPVSTQGGPQTPSKSTINQQQQTASASPASSPSSASHSPHVASRTRQRQRQRQRRQHQRRKRRSAGSSDSTGTAPVSPADQAFMQAAQAAATRASKTADVDSSSAEEVVEEKPLDPSTNATLGEVRGLAVAQRRAANAAKLCVRLAQLHELISNQLLRDVEDAQDERIALTERVALLETELQATPSDHVILRLEREDDLLLAKDLLAAVTEHEADVNAEAAAALTRATDAARACRVAEERAAAAATQLLHSQDRRAAVFAKQRGVAAADDDDSAAAC